MIDIQKLYKDYNINYSTSGKNVSAGWVATKCPFCQDTGNHLGFSPVGTFSCWKCGKHPFKIAIVKLLHVNEDEVYSIVRKYDTGLRRIYSESDDVKLRIGNRKFKFPSNTTKLTERQKNYLTSRNFDADKLEREWHLLGTGPASVLDNISYKHRIVAPIYWNRECVSFQARDYTNKQTLRYITCPKQREIVHHKNIVYGNQEKWTNTAIIVEGITDVWRFSARSCATFGIEYTQTQIHVIAKNFERAFVIFDSEEQAQKQAEKLVAELLFRNVDAMKIEVDDDPGSMSQDDADYLVKSLT